MRRLLHCTIFCCIAMVSCFRGPVGSGTLRALDIESGMCIAASLETKPPARVVPAGARTRNVILVALDGVRFQEIFGGVDASLARRQHIAGCDGVDARALLPHLYARAVDGGVAVGAPDHGEAVFASGPNFVSLPGYLEILSGRTSSLTRRRSLFGRGSEVVCTDNTCGGVTTPTLLDELRASGLGADQVAVISSWEEIERAASQNPENVTLSAGRHGGATRDRLRIDADRSRLLDEAASSSARPGVGDYRADRFTAPLALAYLEAKRPRFLFIGLGDTDEHAHRRDYAGYLDALRSADRFAGDLFAALDGMGRYGEETTVIFTADHGRNVDFEGHGSPESARVWLLAAGGAVPARGFVSATEPHHLADIAPSIRALLDLSPDASPNAGHPIAELAGSPSAPVALSSR